MADVELKVNGRKYRGWKTARVTRGIEAVCGSFALGVTEKWSVDRKRWPFVDGDQCTVTVGGVTIVTGEVGTRRRSFGSEDHSVEITGRDAACALVDCSAVLDKWEFKEVAVAKFVEKICDQFGIKLTLQSGLSIPTVPKRIAISPGTKAFQVIEEVCRLVGVLAVSDGKGGLMLTRAGTERCDDQLVEGENMTGGSSTFDSTERFRRVIVMGQHHGASDEFFGEDAAHVKGSAEDPNVKNEKRVLIIRPEGGVTAELAKKRAQWEVTTRAVKGDAVTAIVQGWKQSSGAIWPINKLVRVKSPELEVNGDMLITQADYHASDRQGTTTTLTLKHPNAFKPEPVLTKDSGLWKEISSGV